MTLEDWNTLLQFASAVLLGLTFAVGAGAIWTGYVLGKRQEGRIAATEEGTAEANKKAAEANERSTRLELEAAQQRERAAKAEHDLLALQQRLAPRRISPTEHAASVSALKPFAGATVELTRLGDSEAGTFADDLISVLTEAGWRIDLRMIGMFSPPRYGLQCEINEESPAGKALAAVARKLPTVHVDSVPELPTVARIFVGLKP